MPRPWFRLRIGNIWSGLRKVTFEYASEKLNVPAAKAEVTAAKVFNDPNLSVSYFNNENNSLQMGEGVEVELSKTFSLETGCEYLIGT